jgi:hypothetical protein
MDAYYMLVLVHKNIDEENSACLQVANRLFTKKALLAINYNTL